MKRISLFLCLLTVTSFAQVREADKVAIAKIIDEGRSNSHVMRHLHHLTNRIGPRLTSSANCTKACEWAVERFKSFGIENARMVKWGTFPVGYNRGLMKGRMVTPTAMDLEFTTPSWTPGTKGMQRGIALVAPKDMDELKLMRDQLEGTWLVEGRMDQRRRFRGIPKDMEEAYIKAGVLGIISSSGSNLVRTFGGARRSMDEIAKLTRITVNEDHHKKIRDALEEGREVTLEFDIEGVIVEGPIPLYNVIADIKGSEFPDEYVVIGAHIDSWDGATGTTDNGTGVATTIEAARLLMATGAKPRRTIRFMLWSGEEQGLLGSRAWIEQNPQELEKISGCFVHDGGTNYVSGVAATKAMKADFEKIFAPAMTLNDEMKFTIRDVPGLPEGVGSDHDAFLRANVPGFFWSQSGRAVYRRTWHTQNDTFDAAIPEYQQHTSMVVAIGALGVANLDHKLSREGLKRPRLGLNFDRGMVVTQVVSGGVAAKAGIKKGDKLLMIGETEVKDRRGFRRAMASGSGERTITVLRDGKKVEITANWPSGGRRRR